MVTQNTGSVIVIHQIKICNPLKPYDNITIVIFLKKLWTFDVYVYKKKILSIQNKNNEEDESKLE